jgi:hypothetical protein
MLFLALPLGVVLVGCLAQVQRQNLVGRSTYTYLKIADVEMG